MSTRNILIIARKELKSYFDHINGYLLIVIFLGLLYFFFTRTFFISQIASMRGMFNLLPWIFTFMIPAITMGAFAAEKDRQTIEYLMTKPTKVTDLILGKILGNAAFLIIALLTTLPLAFFINNIGTLDFGETAAGYFGGIVLILSLTSFGVMISSFFKNQIAAFLTSAAVIVALNIISTDIASANLPLGISKYLAEFSIIDRFTSITRGVLEIRDLVYFILLFFIPAAITYINVQKIRLSSLKAVYRTASLVIAFVLFISTLIIYSTQYARGRIDLTSAKQYTLSPVTKEVLKDEGKVKIDVYLSENMPQQYRNLSEEVKNVLTDYEMTGGNNISVNYFDPKEQQTVLQQLAIQPVQFNVVGEDQFQIQQGYMALVVTDENDEKQEKIDFLGSIGNIEYELTRLINKVKQTEKAKIGFTTGAGEREITADYGILADTLESDYTVETVSLPAAQVAEGDDAETTENSAPTEIPDLSQYELLIIADPKQQHTEEAKQAIDQYIQNGGDIIYLADGVDIQPEMQIATKPPEHAGTLLEEYGIKVSQNMIYDLRANLPIGLNTQFGVVRVAYPPLAVLNLATDEYDGLPQNLLGTWASSLEVTNDEWTILYETSPYAGSQTDNFVVDPQGEFSQDNLRVIPVAAIRKPAEGDNTGTLVIAGSARMLDNESLQGNVQNTLFIQNFAERFAQGKAFSQIQSKDFLGTQFIAPTEQDKIMVRYGSIIASILILTGIGISRIIYKRKLAQTFAS